MKEYLRRGAVSFAISAFAGLLVNLCVDVIANACGAPGFVSMSPAFRAIFPTHAVAAYVNVLLYGLIGFSFAVMSFIYDVEHLGFLVQSVIYFVVTSAVCIGITMVLWQLQRYPAGFYMSLAGYAATHVIMFVTEYRKLKEDIKEINEISVES